MGKRKKQTHSEDRAAERAETERIMRRLEERIAYHKKKLAEEAQARKVT
jgi:hypothetical protein